MAGSAALARVRVSRAAGHRREASSLRLQQLIDRLAVSSIRSGPSGERGRLRGRDRSAHAGPAQHLKDRCPERGQLVVFREAVRAERDGGAWAWDIGEN
jgi:hypothetical protein